MTKATQKTIISSIIEGTKGLPEQVLTDTLAKKEVKLGTLTLPKTTKESKLYLITETMGERPRWFEKKRLNSFQKQKDGSWKITLPERAIKDRGLQDLMK